MVQLFDTLDAATTARICADGSLVAEVRGARTGIQEYLGREVDPTGELGLRDKAIVRVYRPADEVFKRDSLASFSAAPVTIDHPSVMVNADNWRTYGVGEINGDVVRDGEFVRVPIIVRDAAAVAKVRSTHKQLSMGYTCTLDATPGTTPDGQAYDAVQRDVRINHIAAVPAARGGPELKISDERSGSTPLADGVSEAISLLKKAISLHEKHMNGTAPTTGVAGEKSQKLMMSQMMRALSELESDPSEKPMKMDALVYGENTMKIKIGDAEVDATNGEAVRIAVDSLNAKLATYATDKASLEAKVVTLEKQVADAKLTPAQLRDAARAFQIVADKAKALGVTVSDEMDEPAIMRAAVTAKLGDAAKDWTDAQFAASFAALTADMKVSDAAPHVHNLAPAKFADSATVVASIRAARYA